MTVDIRAIRERSDVRLAKAGFRRADWLPLLDESSCQLRPRDQIVRRLCALAALLAYVSAPPEKYPEKQLRTMVTSHRLQELLTIDELKLWKTPRSEAHNTAVHTIGWKLENMVPLAWALGNKTPLCIDGNMIGGDELQCLMAGFIPVTAEACQEMLNDTTIRTAEEIVEHVDLFYCAHNAVRNAQIEGTDSVPDDFDLVSGAGVIHERRHALEWMVAPGSTWDETQLDT